MQSIVDYARTFPELNPVLATGGFSQQPALTIANDVMISMVAPAFNWKWNRFKLPVIYTNPLEQDYAVPGLVNLAWLEHGVVVDINSTALPKPIWVLETNRDLEMTSVQYGRPGQVSWLPNDQLVFGAWLPNQLYGKFLGVPNSLNNPSLQIQDSFGNIWVLTNNVTQDVTTGAVNPFLTNLNPVFPTPANPTLSPTTVTDNTAVWTAVNPKGQGIRLNPIPTVSGVVYQINLIGQLRPPSFASLAQTIEPVPDDFASYFRRGFIAYSHMHSKDQSVRTKFHDQYQLWMTSLTEALRKGDRERDNTGLIPTDAIMQNPYSDFIGPANPFWPAGF